MEVLQSNTADNIYFWIEDRVQGNVNPIYESHGAYEIYIVCNGERRMYLGNVLYKVGTGDALMIPASTPHRSFGDGAFSGICIEFSDAYIKEHFTKSQYYKITECFKTPLISLPPDLLPIIRTYSLTAYNNVDVCLQWLTYCTSTFLSAIRMPNAHSISIYQQSEITYRKTTLKSKDLTLFRSISV